MARRHPKPHLVHVVEARTRPEDLTTPGANIEATLGALAFIEQVHTIRPHVVAQPLNADDFRYMAMSRRLQNRFGR